MGEPKYWSVVTVTGDTLIKTGRGTVHTVTFTPNDAAATAGTITLFDNTAESGTALLGPIAFIAAYAAPVTLILDAQYKTGLYVGFTTTADINVTVTYQ